MAKRKMDRLDIAELMSLKEQRLLAMAQDGDYVSWCYTDRVQYDRLWTPLLEKCRGIITDTRGYIIARPFSKFFNADEKPDDFMNDVHLPFEITDKIDGSLIVVTAGNPDVIVASKNSFTSDQAVFARDFIFTHLDLRDGIRDNPEYTFVFEAIYPANRIILDYGDLSDLILLGIIHTDSGVEQSRHFMEEFSRERKASVVSTKRFDNIDAAIEHTKNQMMTEGEGIVIRFSNGRRYKVKSMDYVRLHRLASTISMKRVLDVMASGQDVSSIYGVLPDEFYQEVRSYERDIRDEYDGITSVVNAAFDAVKDMPMRGDQARTLYSSPAFKEVNGAVFAMLDGHDPTKVKWKLVRRRILSKDGEG
jgi:RNA ligase